MDSSMRFKIIVACIPCMFMASRLWFPHGWLWYPWKMLKQVEWKKIRKINNATAFPDNPWSLGQNGKRRGPHRDALSCYYLNCRSKRAIFGSNRNFLTNPLFIDDILSLSSCQDNVVSTEYYMSNEKRAHQEAPQWWVGCEAGCLWKEGWEFGCVFFHLTDNFGRFTKI